MRAKDLIELRREAIGLAFLKKPTRKQARRLAEIAKLVDGTKWHPTGPAPKGIGKPDISGINWRSRVSTGHMTAREIRRANRFGRGGERPQSSRRQRKSRKQRTGGVK